MMRKSNKTPFYKKWRKHLYPVEELNILLRNLKKRYVKKRTSHFYKQIE